MADSLIGRIRTHDVYMVDINSSVATLRATTKAPSLNADKRTKYKKIKSVQYPINLKSGDTYFVKCGFLNQNVFDLPRQPTLTLLKSTQTKKYLRKRFLREKIKDNLYEKWLSENGI
ncbi:hypothetical protein FNH22_17895 [Fulvivirga sp. M361]|uniref:hypothetical protein n=1 Tax=Fulvivirga sp. M361 TaxID=2594266 RepID=UPI00117B4404|nr:hypothetical protein [Fulvivirga sp. M361]TRX55510.1 hypothetical protein FNH22_17895 [Fulvivirga sp. M361]